MTSHGFPSSRRLHHTREFDHVFNRNRFRVSTREFLILAVPNETNESRLGMVIGKKVSPRAVDRNRVKRIVREVFRTTEIPAVDIVVLARRPAVDRPGRILSELLSKTFVAIGEKYDLEGWVKT